MGVLFQIPYLDLELAGQVKIINLRIKSEFDQKDFVGWHLPLRLLALKEIIVLVQILRSPYSEFTGDLRVVLNHYFLRGGLTEIYLLEID